MPSEYSKQRPRGGRDVVDTRGIPNFAHKKPSRPMDLAYEDRYPTEPPTRDDGHVDQEALLRTLYKMMREGSGPHEAAPSGKKTPLDKYEEELTPWGKFKANAQWFANIAKWIGGVVLLVFTGGVAYQQFVSGNATRDDLGTYDSDTVQPLIKRVEVVESDVATVKSGVTSLVQAEKDRSEIERQKALLDAYRADYQEALSEYTADKAAGRWSERPRKDPEHIELEAELKKKLGP